MNATALSDLFKKYLLASILVGVSIILLGAIIFRSSEIPAREQAVEEKTAEGQRLQANITNSALLHEHVDELARVNKELSQQLVNPNQLGENLQFFYRIEAATGAKIVDVRQTYSPQTVKGQKGSFVGISYTVSIQGDFRTVLNFVRKIEKSNRISRIMSASFGQSANGERAGVEIVSMNLNIELLGSP